MRICAFPCCSNSTYTINRWRKSDCEVHVGLLKQDCQCSPPFILYPFPQDIDTRREWVKLVNRKDPKTGKNWQPNADSRVCSKHFVDGKPTTLNPSPASCSRKRGPPKVRNPATTTTSNKHNKKQYHETDINSTRTNEQYEDINQDFKQPEPFVSVYNAKEEHSYALPTSDMPCPPGDCSHCFRKQEEIELLKLQLNNAYCKIDDLGSSFCFFFAPKLFQTHSESVGDFTNTTPVFQACSTLNNTAAIWLQVEPSLQIKKLR